MSNQILEFTVNLLNKLYYKNYLHDSINFIPQKKRIMIR